MKKTFEAFNPMDYLETHEEVINFLHDAFLDEDPQVFISALSYVVKHHGVAEVAEKANLNRESLYKMLSGKTKPTWATVHSLMHALDIDFAPAA